MVGSGGAWVVEIKSEICRTHAFDLVYSAGLSAWWVFSKTIRDGPNYPYSKKKKRKKVVYLSCISAVPAVFV